MCIWRYISLGEGCKGYLRCVLPKRCSLIAVHIYHIYIMGQSSVSHTSLKQSLQLLFPHPCQSPWCVSWLGKERIGVFRLLYRAVLSVNKGYYLFFFQSQGCVQYAGSGVGRWRNKEGRYDKVLGKDSENCLPFLGNGVFYYPRQAGLLFHENLRAERKGKKLQS